MGSSKFFTHKPHRRLGNLFPAVLTLVFALFIFGGLWGQSIRETDEFNYITELFYSPDADSEELWEEIEAFSNRWPDSPYDEFISYMKANMALRKGDIDQSGLIYEELLSRDVHPAILPDILLNFAIVKYHQSLFPTALELLDDLETLAPHPWYEYQAKLWRGRVKAMQELWFSAAEEYQKALAIDAEEARFDYYKVLLALGRDETATAILDSLSTGDPDWEDYHGAWLDRLLTEGRYEDFETHLDSLDALFTNTPVFGLLRTRKALLIHDYDSARLVMDNLEDSGEIGLFYHALLLEQDGNLGAADSIFRFIQISSDPDLAVLSYFERLKIIYEKNPESAIHQLQDYLDKRQDKRGEALHILGQFRFNAGDYLGALKAFIEASNHILPVAIAEKNQILGARCYDALGQTKLCVETSNRYLNSHPQGIYRDQAFYYLAKNSPEEPELAKLNYQRLLRDYPDSPFANQARFALAEIHFYASEYKRAIELYQDVVPSEENQAVLSLRLAQAHYFDRDIAGAEAILEENPELDEDFETALLRAGIAFSKKDFEQALKLFSEARSISSTPQQNTEARSYEAYTLYHMGRHGEASQVFLELADSGENADIYLYQAAKSAAQGKQWLRALEIYDRWLDEFPDSELFLNVLADIAVTNFNLGRYGESLSGWLNILRRFTSNTFVADEDMPLLAEVFTGIETSSRKLTGYDHIEEISQLIDSFKSDYIKFELEYILVKLYANAELWAELLREASQFRQSLDLPSQRQNEFDRLLLESLMRLNRLEEADSLAIEIHERAPSQELMIQWAELAEMAGDTELAQERYLKAFQMAPEAGIWLSLLDLSAQNHWLDFPNLWELGAEWQELHPQSHLQRLGYLFETGNLDEASALADSLLDSQSNPWIRAHAEIWLGKALLEKGEAAAARRAFQRIRLLWQEFPDVHAQACYYSVLSLIALDELQEARLALAEYSPLLDSEQLSHLETLLQEN
ncbi:MAG: tetratricopeptide repeat protein [Candidatus Cloacimonadaceae bacterium]|nr:tetratricopeptide repeat protein [Candidatus Cloacimonadota bacterium]MDX9949917.1 tetratricopeptide repeat protein [Candidatus Syntrophosphaera sp.]NLN84627.1 tetratricopeptide repeat protein [Candidatus Cloacimonadota bacterium]